MQTLSPYLAGETGEARYGRTLQDSVHDRGPLDTVRLRRVALRTAGALAALHRAGRTHGEVSPDSVLLGPDGPKLQAVPGSPAGPGYLAPERIEEEPVGAPADMFSWAATMAYAATGRPPFGAGPGAAVMRRVTSRPPDLGNLQGPLRELAVRCLDKDPAARPTAPQVVRALRDGGLPAAAPRPRSIPRYRSRMMIALAAVIGLGFCLGVLLPG